MTMMRQAAMNQTTTGAVSTDCKPPSTVSLSFCASNVTLSALTVTMRSDSGSKASTRCVVHTP